MGSQSDCVQRLILNMGRKKKCKKLGSLDSFVSGLLTFTKCGREYHRWFKNNLNTVETEKQENVRNVWEVS